LFANCKHATVCDPVLGDEGKLYVPQELISVYQQKVIWSYMLMSYGTKSWESLVLELFSMSEVLFIANTSFTDMLSLYAKMRCSWVLYFPFWSFPYIKLLVDIIEHYMYTICPVELIRDNYVLKLLFRPELSLVSLFSLCYWDIWCESHAIGQGLSFQICYFWVLILTACS